MDRSENASKAIFNGIYAAVLAEKAELHRFYLQHGAVICRVQILDIAVLYAGKGDYLVHTPAAHCRIPDFCELSGSFRAALFSPGADFLLFLLGGILAFEDEVFLFAGSLILRFHRLQLRLNGFCLFCGFSFILSLLRARLGSIYESLVAICPAKMAPVGEEAEDMEKINIVWLLIQPNQHNTRDKNDTDAEPELSRQI